MKLYAHYAAHTQKVMKMENFLHRNRTFLPGKLLIYLRIRLPTFFLSPTFYSRSRKIVSVNPCSQSIPVSAPENECTPTFKTHTLEIYCRKQVIQPAGNEPTICGNSSSSSNSSRRSNCEVAFDNALIPPPAIQQCQQCLPAGNRSVFLTEVPVYYILPCRLKTDYVARQTSYRNQGTREE